jgi:ABC-2 type transport system ATP-binding protein
VILIAVAVPTNAIHAKVSTSMIKIESLSKRYGRGRAEVAALNEISFSVSDGEVVGFVGLNGAGKTTTIRIATGIILPSSGTVTIDGHSIVKEKRKASERIGWVPEFPNFEQNRDARTLLLYFAGFRRMQHSEAEGRAAELFGQLELSGQERKKLRDYSQGMKKRFSLALALLPDPQNLLFDEILNGLDPQGVKFVRSLLMELRRQGKSVLLSSHLLTEIEAVSDRIVFVHKGRLIKSITRGELSAIERGGGALRMTVTNLNEDGLGYLRTLGTVKVESDLNLTLSGFQGDPSTISTELAKRGFIIREFAFEKSSLEDYFFKLVNEADSSARGA